MIAEDLGKSDLKFNRMYRGTVVNVNDPEKKGRIKIKVIPMMNNIDDVDALPWAVPAFSLLSGSGSGFGSFAVPEVDAQVWVFFETGDVYQPVYFAEAATGIYGQPADKDTNYPNRRIFRTKAGIQVMIDDTSGERTYKILHPTGCFIQIIDNAKNGKIELKHPNGMIAEIKDDNDLNLIKLTHPSGSYIEMTHDGKVTAYAPDDAKIQSGKDVNIIAADNVNIQAAGNNVSISAANLIQLSAALLNLAITGNSVVGIQGNVDIDVDGSVDVDATGPIELTGSQVSINP